MTKTGETANTKEDDCSHDYECRLLLVGSRRHFSRKLDIWKVYGSVSSALKRPSTMVSISDGVGTQRFAYMEQR
jgi:hypothetical protein